MLFLDGDKQLFGLSKERIFGLLVEGGIQERGEFFLFFVLDFGENRLLESRNFPPEIPLEILGIVGIEGNEVLRVLFGGNCREGFRLGNLEIRFFV